MAKKIKLTRPELKRQRDLLRRFERYLPMLKLKQQQLQAMIRDVRDELRQADREYKQAEETFAPYRILLNDVAGVNIAELARPEEVKTSTTNIAGVNIPIFEGVVFPKPNYSLFATPAWVDRTLADLRALAERTEKRNILQKQFDLLDAELTKIIQRVNLFEKVKIPECKENIRLIRIKLGDEMTAAVGRGKIAKSKLRQKQEQETQA